MASSSNIEWTDASWNPTVGCTVVSPGCTNCYAMKMAWRLQGGAIASHAANGDPGPTAHYLGTVKDSNAGAVWTGKVALAPDHILTAPLGWKKPKRVFVNSMSDLFHESVPDEWIDRIFAVMALCPQHTFQVLTKRAERMRDYIYGKWANIECNRVAGIFLAAAELNHGKYKAFDWPLSNVWLGVSCERQQEADERIPDLLQTPAAVRFISAEPLLGPIDLMMLKRNHEVFDALQGCVGQSVGDGEYDGAESCPKLDWVIVGGESGPAARQHDIAWSRSIVAQCEMNGVAAFVKQLGSNAVGPHDNGTNQTSYRFKDRKGGDPSEWPEDLRIRQFPVHPTHPETGGHDATDH